MRAIVLALFAVAACSGEGEPGNQAGGNAAASGQTPGALTLTGLYEGGEGERRDQMCIVPGEGTGERFGLVVWGTDMNSCSGTGIATRAGGTLRLAMAGDEACVIEAAIDGDAITLPSRLPSGCAYYCGANASMTGARLVQTGRTVADAGKATDLVGEPMCGTRDG